MVKTYFYLKTGKQNKKGELSIYAKLKYKNSSTTFSTGKSISKKRWEATNHLRNTLKAKDEKALKISLSNLEKEIEKSYQDLLSKNIDFEAQEIKQNLKGEIKSSKDYTFIEACDYHMNNFTKKVKAKEKTKATEVKYKRSKDLFLNYLQKREGIKDIKVSKIKSKHVYDFESFMRYESTYRDKVGIGHNSTVKYIRRLSTILNYSLKRGKIESNPFASFEGKIITKDAVFLTENELKKIQEYKPKSYKLERTKDIFLFSCYTGYAPVEVEKLTLDNLVEENDGTLWIKTNRSKTNIKANVPVLRATKKILEKYASEFSIKLLPTISNQKMNVNLKKVAIDCGIKKNLTHYVARHTFATTVALSNGVSIESVSAMMGHTSLEMTKHYAKILDSSVKKDMRKLNKLY